MTPPLLYLVHRMPYPPDKGDKVRSYHLLKHLATTHRVFVGTFIDDPADGAHVETLRSLCAGFHVARLDPRLARLRSLGGLLTHKALTLGYYRDAGLARWVGRTVAEHGIDTAVVFSSAMSQYVDGLPRLRLLADLVDVDSAKWAAYADARRWPLSWLYRREARRLLAHERRVVRRADRSFLSTEKETDLFGRLAPDCAASVEAMGNGVDAGYFQSDPARPSPFPSGSVPLVFTGAMDYWPNVDAVVWFAREVLPLLHRAEPRIAFHIVGRSPAAAVQALAGEHVAVTGTVADVRPYLQHAAVVVAPLRLARGIQNKVLEAMAMARPVVASADCAAAIDAEAGRELVPAGDAADFARRVGELLQAPARAAAIGAAARERVLAGYSWTARLSRIDRHLVPARAGVAEAGAAPAAPGAAWAAGAR